MLLSLYSNHEYIWGNGHTAAIRANLATKFGLMESLTLWLLYRRRRRQSVTTAQGAARGQTSIFKLWRIDKSLLLQPGFEL